MWYKIENMKSNNMKSKQQMNHLIHIEINRYVAHPSKMTEKPPVLLLDYDQTLVVPKDGRPFPKDVDDWQWLFPSVPSIITKMYNDGYRIVICSNQTRDWKCKQIENALSTIEGVKMDVCIAMEKSVHKPSTAMMGLLAWFGKEYIDIKNSLFIGDALGRKNDYSDCDKVFAETLGIRYFNPESFFDVNMSENESVSISQNICIPVVDGPEVIIMVGYPGSGKSTAALDLVEKCTNYEYISGDICKTSTKMISTAKKILKDKKTENPSFIFDATNPTIEKRSEYIMFALENQYKVRCVFMASSYDESKRRNIHRTDNKKVPDIVYNIYRKKFEEPNETEGFTLLKLN